MPDSIEAVTHDGDSRTIHVPDRTPVNRAAIHRAQTDGGLRLHLVDTLWNDPDREPPTGAAQIGGYIYEIADRLATTLEADLLAHPAGWKCVCGALNEGFWTSRDTCRGCRIEAAKPSQVAAHFRMVGQPSDNGVIAARLRAELAAARARLLHPTPAELVAAHAECDTLCPTCIYPAPCPTRRALDGQE
jgi:hypothetical protein